MKQLADMGPDELLEVMERRQDAYLEAAAAETREKTTQEALEATTYKLFRAEGMSQEDSKQAMRADEARLKGKRAYDEACSVAARKRAELDRSLAAIRLWQTQRADQRRI